MGRIAQKKPITIELINEFIDYNPDTGSFTWKKNRGNVKAGQPVGSIHNKTGHLEIKMLKNTMQASRVAWVITHGSWPTEIDHINCDPADDRLVNLREVTRHQNICNRRIQKNSPFKAKGVSLNKEGKLRARIKVNRKEINLGTFDTVEEASYFYQYANAYYHGEFGRVV